MDSQVVDLKTKYFDPLTEIIQNQVIPSSQVSFAFLITNLLSFNQENQFNIVKQFISQWHQFLKADKNQSANSSKVSTIDMKFRVVKCLISLCEFESNHFIQKVDFVQDLIELVKEPLFLALLSQTDCSFPHLKRIKETLKLLAIAIQIKQNSSLELKSQNSPDSLICDQKTKEAIERSKLFSILSISKGSLKLFKADIITSAVQCLTIQVSEEPI